VRSIAAGDYPGMSPRYTNRKPANRCMRATSCGFGVRSGKPGAPETAAATPGLGCAA
jgi:hypothetical protein